MGIGGELIEFVKRELKCEYLWALEKNEGAIRFYKRHGFTVTSERKPEEGTLEYLVKLHL